MAFHSDEPRDDVDRLFARMEKVDPPPDLTQRIMRSLPAQVPAAQPQRVAQPRLGGQPRQRGWQWAAAIAGVIFVVMSVWLGNALNDSGSLSLLGDAFGDTGTFWNAPGAFFAAFFESLPWLEVIVTLMMFAAFWYSSAAAVDRSPQTRRR
jgi:hypothetical protein